MQQKMRWGLILVALWCVHVTSALRMTNTRVGSYIIYLVYDENQPPEYPTVATKLVSPTPTTSGELWLLRVTNNASTPAVVNATIGQTVFSSKILTGPNGCSNVDPAKRTTNVNCATTTLQALINRDQLQNTWYLEYFGPNGELCIIAGGEQLTCLGQVHWARSGVDTFVVADNPSPIDILFSQYAFLPCALGPYSNFPCTFLIDTPPSQLVILAPPNVPPCYWPPNPARTYDGSYNPFPYDAYSGYFLVITWSFERQNDLQQLRVLFRRTSATSESFYVELADTSGDRADSYFSVWWRSNFTVDSPVERTFPQYLERLLTFYNPSNSSQQCQTAFYVTPPPSTPVLIPKPVTTINNYVYTLNSPLYRASMFEVGALDENGFLIYPNCGAEMMCRCIDASRLSSNGKRMNMTAWKSFEDYTLRCEQYPFPTFNSFGTTGSNGPEVRRDQPESALCNAPFLVPETILSLNNPQEKAFQCALQHMYVSASTGHCSQVVSRSFCRLGSFPYDFRCYYMYNFEVDKGLRGPILNAQKSCDSIYTDFPAGTMSPLSGSDPNFLEWYSRILKLKCDPNIIVRIVNGQGNCFCVQCLPAEFGPPTVITPACLCGSNAFSPCSYPMESYEVIGQWQSWSPNMISYLKQGEPNGSPFDGSITHCDPASGWMGSRGETAVVPGPTDFTVFQVGNGMTTSNSVFYAQCINLGHGSAFQGQPLTCYCTQYFGPIATLLPTNNTAFRQFPCRCPASSTVSTGSFKVNGVVYPGDGISYDICDTLNSGECLTNSFSGIGVCSCASSLPLNVESPFPTEPIKGGSACTCFRPQVPADGRQNTLPIVQSVCNGGAGVCCGGSGGEGIDERCFDSTTGENKKGCVCTTNGVGGEACTCSAPRNLLFGSNVLIAPGFAYSKMTVQSFVGVVYTQTRRSGYYLGGFAGCNVTQVSLTNNPFSSTMVNCTYTVQDTIRKWLCPTREQWFFVVAFTQESAPRCLMQAFEQDIPVGGPPNNTNKFAGRMFAIKELRQFGLYYRQQQVVFSSNGCTHYGDMCNANFDGAGCLAGVSSIRIYDAQQVVMVCSASTTVGGGQYAGYIVRNPVTGFQQCACNAFTSTSGNNGPQNPGVMVGNACQCASYYVQERGLVLPCGGHGPCVQPAFALGFCELTLERYLADPLAQPFVDIGGQVQNQYQQVFYNRQPSIYDGGAGDLRSVLSVLRGGTRESWFVSPQQIFYLQGVAGDVGQHCGRNVRDTLPIEFLDSPNALPLQRAEAVVTIWYANGTITTETCDPAKLIAEPGACSARVYCLETWVAAGHIIVADLENYAMSPCIAQQIWQVSSSTDTLTDCLVTVDFLCARALSIESNSLTITSAQYPTWQCNVAFERTIDWMSCMDKCDEDYVLQCSNTTMTYNDFDLGIAFGIYYNQVFNCPFADNYLDWVYCNYKLIATTMNSERCFYTRDNTTVQLMNDGRNYEYVYTWASRVIGITRTINQTLFFNGLDLNRTILNFTVRPTAANTAFVTFNYDVLYERTLGYLAATDYDYSPQLLDLCVQFYWWAVKTIELYQTNGPSVTTDPQLQTYGADVPWFVLDSLKRGWLENARPGVWQTIVGIDPGDLLYLNVTFPQDLDLFVVFTPTNELCAVTFNVVANDSRLLTCDFADTGEARNWFGGSQALFDAVMDVAEQMIGAHATDLAFSSTELYTAMMQFFQAHAMDGDNGFKLWSVPKNFKYVLNGTNASLQYTTANTQFLTQKQIPPTPNFQSYLVTVTPVVTRNDWVERWNNMSYDLYVNHQSPYNPVWDADKVALVNQGVSIWCRAIDYNSAEDQKYLADIWYTYYAPFRCSQSNACKTTSRSHGDRCVFDARLYQPWYNGDPAVVYNGVGNEGGCKNWQNPSKGFYDRVRFGQTCTTGYGPYTVNEFTDTEDFQTAVINRYNLTYYPLFDPTTYPFNQYVGPSSAQFVDQLDDFLSCRLPWNLAQRGKLCSGRGFVNVYNTTATVQITTYALISAGINLNTRVFPRCNSIEFSGSAFILGPVFNARNLVYASGLDRISVLDESVWFTNGTLGTSTPVELECTSSLVWTCSSNVGSFVCHNSVLYDPDLPHDAMQIVGFDVKSYTTFLVTLTDADE